MTNKNPSEKEKRNTRLEKMLCAKCGVELERGTTYLRQKDGSTIHAKGDYCAIQKEKNERLEKLKSIIKKNLYQ